jgi:hypothetical protein
MALPFIMHRQKNSILSYDIGWVSWGKHEKEARHFSK